MISPSSLVPSSDFAGTFWSLAGSVLIDPSAVFGAGVVVLVLEVSFDLLEAPSLNGGLPPPGTPVISYGNAFDKVNNKDL